MSEYAPLSQEILKKKLKKEGKILKMGQNVFLTKNVPQTLSFF